MSNSFHIIICGKFSCSLKRRGESGVRLFSDPTEAMCEVRRKLRGERGEVTITNPFTDSTRILQIDPAKPLPAVTEMAA